MAARSDVELMEALIAGEHRLLTAYEAALRGDAIGSALGEQLRDHQREHVRALERSLPAGAERNPRAIVPSPELIASLRDRESFIRFAIALEERLVGDYAGSIPKIRDAELRQPLGSILACGAAHVVALRESLGSRYLTD
jgi:hypothetical protein